MVRREIRTGSSDLPEQEFERVRSRRNRYEVVYAVVRAGGRQEKVEVGTIVVLDRQAAKIGDKIELPAVLFVDGDTVTTDADKLAKVTVTAEVLGEERGPKIIIQKFKNKTGYKKRQGHRQDLTRVKVTGIK
jgi:large subunit ribosomal protein L21